MHLSAKPRLMRGFLVSKAECGEGHDGARHTLALVRGASNSRSARVEQSIRRVAACGRHGDRDGDDEHQQHLARADVAAEHNDREASSQNVTTPIRTTRGVRSVELPLGAGGAEDPTSSISS